MLTRLIITAALSASTALAVTGSFNIRELPRGKDVTLPRSTVTYVPVAQTVRLAATDLPQTIKFSAASTPGLAPRPFKIAIYSNTSDKVTYITLKPGASYMYSFKEIGTISVITEVPKRTARSALQYFKMRVESNKPINITR